MIIIMNHVAFQHHVEAGPFCCKLPNRGVSSPPLTPQLMLVVPEVKCVVFGYVASHSFHRQPSIVQGREAFAAGHHEGHWMGENNKNIVI